MLFWILRGTLAFVLGLVLFAAFLASLATVVALKLFDDRPYADALAEQDAYRRFFDQVLTDDSPNSPFRDLLVEVPAVGYEEQVALLREIIPPSYWQAQVESNLARSSAYWRGEVPTLELYLDLTEPRSQVRDVIRAYLNRFVDRLDIIDPASSLHLTHQFDFARDVTESLYVILVVGEVPEAVPPVTIIPGPIRPTVFDLVMTQLPQRLGLDQASRRELERAAPTLRERFVAGDTRDFLRLALATLVLPLVEEGFDQAIARLPQDGTGRVNLLALAASELGYSDSEAFSREIAVRGASLRQYLIRARLATLVVTLAAALAMGLVFLPNWRVSLRWSGLGMLMTGMAGFALAWVAQARLPEMTANLIADELTGRGWTPPAVELAADILRALAENLLSGAGTPGLWLALSGSLLFLAPNGWDKWHRTNQPDHESGTR